jgi:hypothetical protein
MVQSPSPASSYKNTERKKTQREEREVAILAVLADGGMGWDGDEAISNYSKKFVIFVTCINDYSSVSCLLY